MYGLPVSDIADTILKPKGCPITCQAGTEGTKKYSSANTRSCPFNRHSSDCQPHQHTSDSDCHRKDGGGNFL